MADENVTTPAGTVDDPYIATTWDELVTLCATTSAYVKVANDINVLLEYRDGTLPQLRVLCAELDGDNKTISNIYKASGSESCIYVNSTAKIKNLNVINVNSTKMVFECEFSNPMPLENCNAAGICSTYFVAAEHMRSCSFTVDSGTYPAWLYYDDAIVQDCRFKIKTSSSKLFWNTRGTYSDCSMYNCYIEADAPNYTGLEAQSSNTRYDNCAFDITTNNTATMDPSYTSGGYSKSIVNQTHAPNLTASNMVAAVADTDWLNVTALQQAGFKIY